MFRSPSLPALKIRNKRAAIPYKRLGRSRWGGRIGTKIPGGLSKGLGFGASVVLIDAGICKANKAINAREAEEVDSDQSQSTGLIVIHNKGDSEESPIYTHTMAALTIILIILMTGLCLFRRLKRFLGKGKKTTHPDPANFSSPPGNLSIPRYPGGQDSDNGKRKTEDYFPTRTDDAERAARATETLKRESVEEEARQARESRNLGHESRIIEALRIGNRDEEPKTARET